MPTGIKKKDIDQKASGIASLKSCRSNLSMPDSRDNVLPSNSCNPSTCSGSRPCSLVGGIPRGSGARSVKQFARQDSGPIASFASTSHAQSSASNPELVLTQDIALGDAEAEADAERQAYLAQTQLTVSSVRYNSADAAEILSNMSLGHQKAVRRLPEPATSFTLQERHPNDIPTSLSEQQPNVQTDDVFVINSAANDPEEEDLSGPILDNSPNPLQWNALCRSTESSRPDRGSFFRRFRRKK